ncbi:MAG TPA: M23 family metallopeptidase [Acidobacteriota bacterium]|nr:M23 family metallopeptidase [Acidobacteriota bacterium]
MARGKYVTVMLVPDGTDARTGFRIRRWLLKTILITIGAILAGIVVFFLFYGKVLTRAAITEAVMKENEDLRRYRYKVGLLEQNLEQAREVVSRLAGMAGIDYEFPELPSDSTIFAQLDKTGKAIVARSTTRDWTLPEGLPIQGFITQEFEVEDQDHFHPGVDIVCAVGTPVLATASGVVAYADYDSTYGHMVVLKHSDSVVTIYGHNSELLVLPGQAILVGSRIALSGSTGKSTAPHLHYEIRVNDEPLNPLENLYEKK